MMRRATEARESGKGVCEGKTVGANDSTAVNTSYQTIYLTSENVALNTYRNIMKH
jgi:hypothetical protein